MGTGARGRRAGRADYRRGRDRQVAAGAALPRAARRDAAYLDRGGRGDLFPEHALLSDQQDAAAVRHRLSRSDTATRGAADGGRTGAGRSDYAARSAAESITAAG